MSRYSVFAIAREAFRNHQGWTRAWAAATPKPAYDAVIVGAVGHGLASAYYLGKNHGITNVAVIEKGWLGGGNTGRNTTIIRSNYLQDPSAAIYEKARSLYETMSQDLNYNVMFSPRGVMMLAKRFARDGKYGIAFHDGPRAVCRCVDEVQIYPHPTAAQSGNLRHFGCDSLRIASGIGISGF